MIDKKSFSTLPSQAQATPIRMTDVRGASGGNKEAGFCREFNKYLEIIKNSPLYSPHVSHKKMSSRSEARDLQVFYSIGCDMYNWWRT
jgi:hypothetical protein